MRGCLHAGHRIYTKKAGISSKVHAILPAKRLLAEALCRPAGHLPRRQDMPTLKAWGRAAPIDAPWHETSTSWRRTGHRLSRAGHRNRQLHMYPTWHFGVDCANPATNKAVRAMVTRVLRLAEQPRGRGRVAGLVSYAKTLDEEKMAVRRLNKAALDHWSTVPLGLFMMNSAWRRNVTGISGPLPFFWGSARAFDALSCRPAMKTFLIPEVLARLRASLKGGTPKRASGFAQALLVTLPLVLGRVRWWVFATNRWARKSLHVCNAPKADASESLRPVTEGHGVIA